MLKNFTYLLLLILAPFIVTAQTVVINTGVAGTPAYNAGPVYRSSAGSAYDASRYTYLYTAAELQAVGIAPGVTITTLGWTKNNAATTTGGGIFAYLSQNLCSHYF